MIKLHPSINVVTNTGPKIPSGTYHEPWSLLDVFSGDSQEQDTSKPTHQQCRRDNYINEVMSHEAKVRSAAFSQAENVNVDFVAGRKVDVMLSQPA